MVNNKDDRSLLEWYVGWAHRIHSNIAKYKVLHVETKNADYTYNTGDPIWGCSDSIMDVGIVAEHELVIYLQKKKGLEKNTHEIGALRQGVLKQMERCG